MVENGSRREAFGLAFVIAQVDGDGTVRILDPAKARRGTEVRLSDAATIENLLAWWTRRPAADDDGHHRL